VPIYEYRCENGHTFEVMQRMTDDPVTTCEIDGAPVSRVFHPVAVHFKGKGFYNTDYGTKRRNREMERSAKDGADKTEAKASEKKSESKSSSSTSEKKSDAKPAIAAAPEAKDPIKEIVAKAEARNSGADLWTYFLQAGAFNDQGDAEGARAKLALMGVEAHVTEKPSPNGTGVLYRVRIGPFTQLEAANRIRSKLSDNGVDATMVRIAKNTQ